MKFALASFALLSYGAALIAFDRLYAQMPLSALLHLLVLGMSKYQSLICMQPHILLCRLGCTSCVPEQTGVGLLQGQTQFSLQRCCLAHALHPDQ